MAKKRQSGQNARYAVNQSRAKQAREQAAREQSALEKRRENAKKNRRMGNAFLYAVLSLVGVFCLYTLFRLLFFRTASVSELRDDLLFVSLVSVPYLLAAAAVLIRVLNRKRRESWSDRGKRLAALAFGLVLLAALLLFGWQLLEGKRPAADEPAYAGTVSALKAGSLPLTEPEAPFGVRSLLEYSLQADLRCGETSLRLNYHADGSGLIVKRFRQQLAQDYADCPLSHTEDAELWGPAGSDGSARAALAFVRSDSIRILELSGPREELELLLSLLTGPQAAD